MRIIISGATASGKSALALALADYKNIAIVNADALQIYRGLPILSSQPNEIEQKKVLHFLYSHFNFDESCSVGLWLDLVKSSIKTIEAQEKIPVIVGGSGMYISKLLDGIAKIPEIDEALQIKANQCFMELGREKFIAELVSLGEDLYKIEHLDKQRLIRAYEVLMQTKKSIFWWQNQPHEFLFDPKSFVHVNLNIPRQKLYENCNLRFEKMLENGAIEEVQSLINQGVAPDLQITKTLGFLEIQEFLKNKMTKEKTIEIAAQKTRNYAKRQLTWFRHQFQNKIEFDNAFSALNFLKN